MDLKELQDGVNRLMSNMPEGTVSASFSWKKNDNMLHVTYSESGTGSAQIFISDFAPSPQGEGSLLVSTILRPTDPTTANSAAADVPASTVVTT